MASELTDCRRKPPIVVGGKSWVSRVQSTMGLKLPFAPNVCGIVDATIANKAVAIATVADHPTTNEGKPVELSFKVRLPELN